VALSWSNGCLVAFVEIEAPLVELDARRCLRV